MALFHVPRSIDRLSVESGEMVESDAVTAPAPVALNGKTTAPFGPRVWEKVSVRDAGGVVGVCVGVVGLLHAAAAARVATAARLGTSLGIRYPRARF